MHTANRLSRLSSFLEKMPCGKLPWGKLRQGARIVLPGLLAISALFGFSFIEARRGDKGSESVARTTPALLVSAPAAATITVNDAGNAAANDGKCTLREAITAANTNTVSGAMAGECAAGMASAVVADNIVFSLGSGTPTINVTPALPTITEPVTIKGNTGGATRVELNGVGVVAANTNGLTIQANNSVIERLVINRFTGAGIRVASTVTGITANNFGFTAIKGCIIGLDASGTMVSANKIGVELAGSSDNIIGSTVVSDRNTISGNTTHGILISRLSVDGDNNSMTPDTVLLASRNKVINSYIGTDVTGRFDLGNTVWGVNVSGGNLSVIGGTTAEERNVISGNNGGGVRIGTVEAVNNKIIGNYIGLDASSAFQLGNGVSGGGGTAPGVLIEDAPNNAVGGTANGEYNFIKHNLQSGGVVVKGMTATNNIILRNNIANNAGLGIDLGTSNGAPSNRVVLTGVFPGNTSTSISGFLPNSPANTNYRIEFFYNFQCDPSGAGEGENYVGGNTDNNPPNNSPVGFINVNSGLFPAIIPFSSTISNFVAPPGTFITATATRLDGSDNPLATSDFSTCYPIPATGQTTCTPVFLPQVGNFRIQGGTQSISMYLKSDCAWTATESLPWASIQSGTSGTGNGTIVINVTSNPGAERYGQILIAGQNYNIYQEGNCTNSLSPSLKNFTSAGGNGTVELITGASCPWSVSNTNDWIIINSATSGTGPTFVDFTVAAYAPATQVIRVGTVMIGGQTFTVIQDPPCGSTIAPANQVAPGAAASYMVGVTIPTGCNWTATKTDSWITLTGATSGNGNGTVNYSLTANDTSSQRTGVIMIAGKTHAISQATVCVPIFDPTTDTIGSGLGNHSFKVGIDSTCTWTPTTNDAWITNIVKTANGMNMYTVTYTVAANSGSKRTGTISVLGQNFAVLQEGFCNYSLNETTKQFQVQGGTASVNVNAPNGCPWTASSQTPWLVITSGASGSGNGTVNYLVTTNGSGSQRVGTMSIAGINYTVQQEGGCTYSVSPLIQAAPSAGGSFTTSVTTTGSCAWTASSNVPWITITSGNLAPDNSDRLAARYIPTSKNALAGMGNGTVGYSVAANTGPPRTGTLFAAGELVTVNQASGCPITISPANLPSGTIGTAYGPGGNGQLLTQVGGIGTTTWSVSNGSLPPGLMLNPTSGLLSGMPTMPGTFGFTVRATDTSPNNCYGEMPYMLVIDCQPLNITTITIPNGTAGAAYNQPIALSGGSGQINWSISAGSLPAGLSLHPTLGILSGAPSVTGMFNFTVKATVNSSGCMDTQALSLTIGCQTIVVNENSLNPATLNASYSQTLTQTGGIGSITWSVGPGSLPTGLTLSSGGQITGTPMVTGPFSFTLKATDANGCMGQKAFTLTVGCPINIGPATLPQGTVNTAGYMQQLTQTGAVGSVTWTLTGGSLPTNLTLSLGGLIAGTPNVPGSFPITVRATDTANGCFNEKAYTLVINCQTIGVSPATLPAGTIGIGYPQSVSQSGGVGTITWSVSAGSLPTGLGLNTSTGAFTGSPTTPGTFNFTMRATDGNNCFGERAYTVNINCQSLSITPATLNSAMIVTPYSQQLTLAGATDWTITAGALPSGITLHPTSGLLSGLPNESGTFNFTVKATIGATGCPAQQAYTLVITCPTITVTPATINNGYLGASYSQQFTQSGGAGNIFWSLGSGSLPNGMTLSATGLLSGTPTMSGNYPITVKATDGNLCSGEKSYTLQIGSCPSISLAPGTLPNGLINTNYNPALTASGGTPGYSYAVTSGALPNGLSLSTAGVFTGSPTVVGSFTFDATATDQAGCTGTRSYTLRICGQITVNPATLPNGTIGSAYNQPLTASGGTSPYSFSNSGTLPTGLTLTPAGILSGTPTANGTFNFSVTAMDANSCVGTRAYTLTITGLQYYPLPKPIRLFDTRAPIAGFTPCAYLSQRIGAGGTLTRSAHLTCDGITIPATARAIVGNATVVNPSGGGFVAFWPGGQPQPSTSNISYSTGAVIPNGFTVTLSATGQFNSYSLAETDLIVDVTGYYAPPGAGGLYYHPLPKPIRLFDSRAPIMGFTPCAYLSAKFQGNTEYTHQARLTCDGLTIPSDASAIVGNATIVSPSGLGHATLWPDGQTRPPVSNLNYSAGQVVPNNFTVGLGANGQFRLYSLATTDMIVDIAGYYSPSPNDVNGEGLLYVPLNNSIRLFDTRATIPGVASCEYLNQQLAAGVELVKQARISCAGETVASSAQAVVGNATVVMPNGLGYATLWPNGYVKPPVSNLNFLAGEIIANGFTLRLGTDGQFRVYSQSATHFIVDLSGYFTP